MLFLAIISFIFGMTGALLIAYFGRNLQLIDTPSHRSSHSTPTPKGGGIGILAAFLFVSLATKMPLAFVIGTGAISLVGLYGDYKDLSPRVRLIFQFLCGALVLLAFMRQPAGAVSFLLPVWLLFLIGTANFYNFMDGINGIAGFTGVAAFFIIAGILLQKDMNAHALVAIAAACSCLGFLPLNIPTARVFMGDVGSILLGFLFAALVHAASTSILDFLCYASLLFPFYIDELSTMAIRLREGEKLSKPHRRHLYQLLANEMGISHWKVSLGFAVFQVVVAFSVLSLRSFGIPAILFFLLTCSLLFIALSLNIRRNL